SGSRLDVVHLRAVHLAGRIVPLADAGPLSTMALPSLASLRRAGAGVRARAGSRLGGLLAGALPGDLRHPRQRLAHALDARALAAPALARRIARTLERGSIENAARA